MMSIVVSDGEARGRENDHVSLELGSRRQEVASIDGDLESLRQGLEEAGRATAMGSA